jgi:transcription initiation factor IIE alpha subunit
MDKYIEKILIGTSLRPMTTIDLSKLYSIPIAECQKKMRLLENLGLVICVRKVVSDEDGTTKVYEAVKNKVMVHKEDGRYVVKIDVPISVALELSRRS